MQMRYILSLVISILSTFVAIGVVVGYCIAYGMGRWSVETATWILFVFGAPTTMLNLVLDKAGFYQSGFLKGVWNVLPIWLLYLIQYQVVAVLIYKGIIDLTTKKGTIYFIVIIVIILISAKIAWNVFRI